MSYAIEARGWSFAYPDGHVVATSLDWRVPQGAFALLVGSTGSGKTTLMRSLKPELAPVGARGGSLAVFGREVADWGQLQSACGIGFVEQDPEGQIVCDTVWHELAFGLENLGMSQDAMRRHVAEVAHFFGLGPIARRATADLSGGQKQTLCVASILALQPRLLLLDEPTSQLDPVAEKNFLHALFRINRELGVTVLITTHEPEAAAEYATACYVLEDGVIREGDLATYRARAEGHAAGGRDAAAGDGRDVGAGRDAAADDDVYVSLGRALEADTARPARAERGGDKPVLRVNDVWFRYEKDAPWVMRGVDVSVAPGEIHALIGGNGCGKSTLMRLMCGIAKPQRGSVRNQAMAAQALLPQNPKALFVCDSVEEELREWQKRCGYSDADVAAAAEAAGLSDALERHPYDLSGGQKQRLALEKLLLTKPGLLLLDEPTKGLDPASRFGVARRLLAVAAAGTTIVLSTHDLAFASRVAGGVTLLFDGEAACSEPSDAFFSNNLFYRPPYDGFTDLFDAWDAAGRDEA